MQVTAEPFRKFENKVLENVMKNQKIEHKLCRVSTPLYAIQYGNDTEQLL